MKKCIVTTAVLASIALLLLSTLASAESDSSRINRERKAIGRALIEVQSANWPSVLPYYTDDIEYPTFDCPLGKARAEDERDEKAVGRDGASSAPCVVEPPAFRLPTGADQITRRAARASRTAHGSRSTGRP